MVYLHKLETPRTSKIPKNSKNKEKSSDWEVHFDCMTLMVNSHHPCERQPYSQTLCWMSILAAVWHVAPSYWNPIRCWSIWLNLGHNFHHRTVTLAIDGDWITKVVFEKCDAGWNSALFSACLEFFERTRVGWLFIEPVVSNSLKSKSRKLYSCLWRATSPPPYRLNLATFELTKR